MKIRTNSLGRSEIFGDGEVVPTMARTRSKKHPAHKQTIEEFMAQMDTDRERRHAASRALFDKPDNIEKFNRQRAHKIEREYHLDRMQGYEQAPASSSLSNSFASYLKEWPEVRYNLNFKVTAPPSTIAEITRAGDVYFGAIKRIQKRYPAFKNFYPGDLGGAMPVETQLAKMLYVATRAPEMFLETNPLRVLNNLYSNIRLTRIRSEIFSDNVDKELR